MKKSALQWENNRKEKLHAFHWPVSNPKAVICFVHGMGEHCERYHHMADFYNQNGIAMIAYDQIGHGKSEGKKGHIPSLDALLDDVTILLKKADEFYPGVKKILYGHSMGGNVCLNYVLRRKPDLAAFITSGPWVRLAFEPAKALIMLGKMMRNLYPGFSQSSNLNTKDISRDSKVVEIYENDPLVHDRITAGCGMTLMESGEWLLAQKQTVPFPTLIMHGGGDRITSADASKEVADNLQGDVTYKNWKGMYHEIHNEPEKQEVFDYAMDWLNARI